jgi:hypothetical protein
MNSRTAVLALLLAGLSAAIPAVAENDASTPAGDAPPALTESYVMLYYKDLTAPRAFYGGLLGLEKTYGDDWVSLYRLTPASFVGIVREGENAFHRVQPQNAVMLSIVTGDVDGWYQRLKRAGGVTFLKEIHDQDNVPIRAFLIRDPGGYSVEFFQWLNR